MSATASPQQSATTELATFGGGCFWCLEAVFERVPGVKSVRCGYAGGQTERPTYDAVCGGQTGHAEVIQIQFDPKRVSFVELLEVFWAAHDPTTLNRQGADVGRQYRSLILYQNETQRVAAEASRRAAGSRFPSPIVTELAPLAKFHLAEDYHQGYYRKNPNVAYCALVIRPKLEKLKPPPAQR